MGEEKQKKYNVAVVGATGNVGREVLHILDERGFPIENIYALASPQSVGTKVSMNLNKQLVVANLAQFDFVEKNVDIAFFCAGAEVSQNYAEELAQNGIIVIDKSSYFRMQDGIPLVVPEVNGDILKKQTSNIIATPNCTTIPLTLCLQPLNNKYKIKRVVVTTFQAVSGTGKNGMDELYSQTKGYYEANIQHLTNDALKGKVYPKQIAFNCIPQCDSFSHDGFTKEEDKIIYETNKILGTNIAISATCVRVPVFRCHAESVNIEFENEFDIDSVIELLSDSPSIIVLDRHKDGGYAVQCESVGTDDVFISRIRRDESIKNGLNLWLVCDNIRKGAALNGVQIAEKLIDEMQD